MQDLPSPPPDLLANASLFLDFDGTLVEIAPTPDAVVVPSGLGPLLERLGGALDGRLAIVSGRAAGEIRAMLPAAVIVAGSHGLELDWPGAAVEMPARGETLDAALEDARRFAATRGGVLVEDKPFGVGLHYRAAPESEEAVLDAAHSLAQMYGLHLQHGKMVAELRLPGRDKGSAVVRLMEEPRWKATRPVVMGDDITDEAAFAAAAALGGVGILVGPERATAARYRLDDVGAARAWLETMA